MTRRPLLTTALALTFAASIPSSAFAGRQHWHGSHMNVRPGAHYRSGYVYGAPYTPVVRYSTPVAPWHQPSMGFSVGGLGALIVQSPAFGYAVTSPIAVVSAPPPVAIAEAPPAPAPQVIVAPVAPVREKSHWTYLTASGHVGQDSVLGDAEFLTEGKRWGLRIGGHGWLVDDGFDGAPPRALQLADVRLAFAPISGSRGRIRLEAGFASLHTGHDILIGPDVGISADLRILGPLGVRGGYYVTAFPFFREVSEAGAFLKLGALRVEAGMRAFEARPEPLSDELLADRWPSVGPYAAVSLVL